MVSAGIPVILAAHSGRSLSDSVFAFAEDVALIVTAFCGRGGECFLVVAYAVFIQEVLINQLFLMSS